MVAITWIMKKQLPFFLFLLLLLFAGCKKEEPVSLSEINAHVLDGGMPAADGIGYYIKIDNTGESVAAVNLPAEFKSQGINAAVAVKFVDTGKTVRLSFGTILRLVYLAQIRKL